MTPRNHVCIVGGATSLQGSKMGKLIDSHPVVIRCNNHPIEGHERDVGQKVTIQSTNFQFMTDKLFYRDRGLGEHWLMGAVMGEGIVKSGPNAPCHVTISDFDNVHGELITPPKAKFEVGHPDAGEWQREYYAHPYPTCGLMTLAMVLHMYPGQGVAIVGYGYRDRVEPGSYEYDKGAERNLWRKYNNADGSTIPNVHPEQHDLEKEQVLINLWESRGLLTRLEPEPNHVCIVGGAASLHGSKLGKRIDDHAIVIRVNHHPLEGHEEDVGEKVTIQCCGGHILDTKRFYRGRGMREYWRLSFAAANVPTISQIYGFDNERGDVITPPKSDFRFPILSKTSEEWEREFHAHFSATTGLRALALALHRYRVEGVSIAGFGYRERLDIGSYEHANNSDRRDKQFVDWRNMLDEEGVAVPSRKKPRRHNLKEERRLINLWESRGLLTRLEGVAP